MVSNGRQHRSLVTVPPVSATTLAIPLTQPQAVPATVGLLYRPEDEAHGTVVLAHGAASGPDSDVLTAVAHALAEKGTAVLSFAFAYRQAGRRSPDSAPRLLAAWRDALRVAREVGGSGPLILGGRSMGGRMASLLAAQGTPCDGLVLLAYPLRGRDRTAHWPDLRVPVLFVSGDRDRLSDLAVLERERAVLAAGSDLVVVRGGDHSFAVRAGDGRTRGDVLDGIADSVSAWVGRRFGSAT